MIQDLNCSTNKAFRLGLKKLVSFITITSQDSLYRRRPINTRRACFARIFLPPRQLALSALSPSPLLMLLFPSLVDRRVHWHLEQYMSLQGIPLDQVLVIVIKATNLTTGGRFVGIDSDRCSVWYASKSAYGTTISAASFALGGSENGSLHYLVEPSEVRKRQRQQGQK